MEPTSALAAAGIGVDLLGGLFARSGQKDVNKTNLAIAREQMAFQERMSNTAYQRAIADMRKAGLNPILAASKGGASSPGGASATMQNPDAFLQGKGTSAMETLRRKQELQNMDVQMRLAAEQLALTNVQKATAYENMRITRNEADLSDTLKLMDKKIYGGKLGELLRRAQLLSSPVSSGSSLMRAIK